MVWVRSSVLLFLGAIILVACTSRQGPDDSPEGTSLPLADATDDAAVEPPAEIISLPTGVANNGPTATPDNMPLVLTMWTSEQLNPFNEAPGGSTLLEQLAIFDERFPDIQVEVLVKRVSGPGSTLEYLRTARDVAPRVLPDLVVLDRQTVVVAAREGLIIPASELLEPDTFASLYPVAQELGRVDSELVALPYLLEFQHIIYRRSVFPEDPPNQYSRILDGPSPFAFPAGGAGNVNQTLLTQYLAEGGRLSDDAGIPVIDRDPLNRVLTFYSDASENGLVDPALFQIVSSGETLALYEGLQSSLAVTSSTAYLRAQEATQAETVLTWIPTAGGAPYALVDSWAIAITTGDARHQQAAIELIDYLLNPANQGAYTQAAGILPSQPAALAVWGNADPYIEFGDLMLQNSQPVPDQEARDAVGSKLQKALEDVLLNGLTPIQAATLASQGSQPSTP